MSQTPISDKAAFPVMTMVKPGAQMVVPAEIAKEMELTLNEMEEALNILVNEKADYMRRNNLGDPDIQFTVVWARQALARFRALKPKGGER